MFILRLNPFSLLGMGFRPMTTVEKTLIKFKQGQKDTYAKYIDDIESFLEGML